MRIKLWPSTWRVWVRASLLVVVPVMLGVLGGCAMIWMPGSSHSGDLPEMTSEETAVEERLRTHVETLAGEIGPRNVWTPGSLEKSVVYIESAFRAAGYEPVRRPFEVDGETVCNVEVVLEGGALADEVVVIGGHYDSVDGCPGANDNGSGTAGVLEVAHLMKDARPARTVKFVAFVNEEPPFFQGARMGSLVYAREAREKGENVVAMISLETIGFYRDEQGTQDYPFPFSLFYPSTGNFIAFVGNVGSRSLVRRCVKSFRSHTQFPSEGAAVPGWITGIGWSDHWAFWETGCDALMVTDTAPFRYPHYHRASDTPDKIDYGRMARVVMGVSRMVGELARGD